MTELVQYIEKIQSFDKDMGQDSNALHSYLIELTNIMARANFLMAENNRKNREAKKVAYAKLKDLYKQYDKPFTPSLAKDYIDSICAETAYNYELAERVSRLCSHTIDAIRTIISSLKSERSQFNYGT